MLTLMALMVASAEPSDRMAEIITPSQLELIRTSPRVEAQRLTGEFDADPNSKQVALERFIAKAAPVRLTDALSKRAKGVATSSSSYVGSGHRCEFQAGVRLRFWASADAGAPFVDVVLCFHCGDVRVSKPEAAWPKQVAGYASLGDYTSQAGMNVPDWLALSRAIFPTDSELKKVGAKQ